MICAIRVYLGWPIFDGAGQDRGVLSGAESFDRQSDVRQISLPLPDQWVTVLVKI
jgi:hypothetical protein